MTIPDPIELRVLTSLSEGARTPADVGAKLQAEVATVTPALEWAVSEGLAERLDLGSGSSYSLTPRGLETLAVRQAVGQVVDSTGHVDFAAASRMVMEGYQAAKDVASEDALREQAGWLADDDARDHVTAGLNQAYAQGALTQSELETRTDQALTARTMGELRAAGAGVVELPPVLPQGIHLEPLESAPSAWQPQVTVNPRLMQIRWGPAGSAVGLGLIGIIVLVIQPLIGVAILLVAAVVLALALRR
jgi:hypothetical protein